MLSFIRSSFKHSLTRYWIGGTNTNKESKSFFIDLLGCEKRKLDAERILEYMKLNGYSQIKDESKIGDADVLIFVSCAFNNEFSTLSKEKVTTILKRKRKDANFIISGCLPEIDPEYLKVNDLDLYVGPRELEKLDTIIESDIMMNEVPEQNLSFFDNRIYPVPDTEYRSPILEEYVGAKNCFKLRVAWGCLSSCSYCAVKRATKNLSSKSLSEIKREMETGISAGHNKFFITGGDVGAYGIDLDMNVTMLLELLTSFKNIDLYIQEFNAQWLVRYADKIEKVLSTNINRYRRLFVNVPIQSGSEYILKRMRRPYSSSQVIKIINKIRKNNHKIRFGSHFIVGFPGETDEEFDKTKKLIEYANLDFIMVFLYSDYPNIDSYKFSGKIDPSIALKRREELLKIQKEIDISENRYVRIKKLDFGDIQSFAETIDGWITPKEGQLLYTLAKNLHCGNIVEIGSWKGKSTFYLASGLIQGDGRKIYSVDRHTGSKEQRERSDNPLNTLPEFVLNMRRLNVGPTINVLVMDSIEASKVVDDEIGLIFLDGSHEYKDIKNDFMNWWSKLKEGGILAFHDTLTKPGVSKLVNEVITERNDFQDPKMVHEITYIRKVAPVTTGSMDYSDFLDMRRRVAEEVFEMKRGVR